MKRNLLKLQTAILFGGSIFAWHAVYGDFQRYYDVESTIWKFKDCAAANPLTTPCFWGAVAFVIAFIWSLYIVNNKIQHKYLLFLLGGGTIFAWSNFTFGLVKFLAHQGDGPVIGCSGQVVLNPFDTPCFIGAVIYLIAFVVSLIAFRKVE